MKEVNISMFILILIISFSVKDVQAADEGKKVFLNFGNVITTWQDDLVLGSINPTVGVSANFRLNDFIVLSPEIYLLIGMEGLISFQNLWFVPSVLLNYKRKAPFFAGFGLGYFLKFVSGYDSWYNQEGLFIKLNIGFRGRKISFTLFYAYLFEGRRDAKTSIGGTIGFGF